MRMINIVSDGTPLGTKVTNMNGEELKGIKSIRWEIDADGAAVATIQFALPELEAIAIMAIDSENVIDPLGGGVCSNADCTWGGKLSDCRQLNGVAGGIGPLCPECGDTVEPCIHGTQP